ncbi:MAG TPA: TetR family transcriptional regulator [Polyangiaceae bacterium]|jgi:AcrR family transcriptional regulator|nr:TetR family transcriptional regulator [Polyangiaceae bacterium]
MIQTIDSQASQAVDGRTRRRIAGMRRVQQSALDLFERNGFDQVTVEQIARAADVGVATVYRQFGTKEGIVLWDEYDPMLFEAIAAKLPARRLRDAILEALIEALDRIYAGDAERILRRARLILTHPSIAAAAAAGQAELRRGLAEVLRRKRACTSSLEADVVAAAVAGTLEAAAAHWVRAGGAPPLRRYLKRAFDRLDRLG